MSDVLINEDYEQKRRAFVQELRELASKCLGRPVSDRNANKMLTMIERAEVAVVKADQTPSGPTPA